jgi:hypothetical protein
MSCGERLKLSDQQPQKPTFAERISGLDNIVREINWYFNLMIGARTFKPGNPLKVNSFPHERIQSPPLARLTENLADNLAQTSALFLLALASELVNQNSSCVFWLGHSHQAGSLFLGFGEWG